MNTYKFCFIRKICIFRIYSELTRCALLLMQGTHKKYMIIAVSVQIWKFTARNNGGAARQESNPQSATTYISERYGSLKGSDIMKK
jgi:hypothetical protein